MPTALETRLKREVARLKAQVEAVNAARMAEIESNAQARRSALLSKDHAVAMARADANLSLSAAKASAAEASLLRGELYMVQAEANRVREELRLECCRFEQQAADAGKRAMRIGLALDEWVKRHDRSKLGELLIRSRKLVEEEVG